MLMRRRAGLRHDGFTLVELVVVVMILGIIAAIAAPRLLSTSDTACDNSLRQTLTVIRDAIDKYAAENSALPGADGNEATFKSDLASYLRGNDFPACPVGDAANNVVRMQAGTGSIASGIGGTAATHGWAYKYQTGDFHVNSTKTCSDGVTTYDQF
jgi:general secretion pathway protein G